MSQQKHDLFAHRKTAIMPNHWDLLALLLVFCLILIFTINARSMDAPYRLGQVLPISLSYKMLPTYAGQTVSRMLIALVFSLLFTFIFGTWAAKNKRAEKIIIPFVDVMQSVPILGFLAISVVAFIKIFPNSLLGPQCACIFVIFTSQAWNMVLGFYQTIKTVPHDLREASDMLHLSAWQRFWRIEVPFSMPGLLWNTMMSMSAGWFFVVASEAISVAHQTILLPGIGSYIAVAIDKADMQAVTYAIIAMFCVILLYDQILFRPLVAWAEKFKAEQEGGEPEAHSWLATMLKRTRLLQWIGSWFAIALDAMVNFRVPRRKTYLKPVLPAGVGDRIANIFWWTFLSAFAALTLHFLVKVIGPALTWHEVGHVMLLGLFTGIRVIILIILCTIVWVPIGVWIGLRPRAAEIIQPIAQFLAAFPAYLLFPVVVMMIMRYHLNVEIWTAPLMILGTQWYILFNVIAGVSVLPKELHYATENFNVRGWLWWSRFILPGIFPYYITGAITAAGGAWNASIVAEVVTWGHTTLRATGLGAYIAKYTTEGDFSRIALGIAAMCVFVLLLNHFLWRPLYVLAEKKFQLD